MPKRYPPEFKRDVVAVARTSGLTHAQIADDFGISEHSVQRWLKQADIDDGVVDQRESVADHGTVDGVPVTAEVLGDLRHRPAVAADLLARPPGRPIRDPAVADHDPRVGLHPRPAPQPPATHRQRT